MNIFEQYARPPKSMADFAAELDARDARRQANAIQALLMRQSEQAAQDESGYRRALSESGGDQNALLRLLQSQGNPKYSGVQKDIFARQKEESEARHRAAQTTDLTSQTASRDSERKRKETDDAIRIIANMAGPEEAAASIQQDAQAGKISMAQAQSMLSSLPQDPAQFPMWQLRLLRGQMAAKDQYEAQLPKMETVNAGTEHVTQGFSKETGKPIPGLRSAVSIRESEHQRMVREQQEKANKDASARGWATLAETKRKNQEDAGSKAAFKETDAQGNVTFFDRSGNKISTATGAGKPSATVEKTKAARAQTARDIDTAITELEKATKDGGLIDQSTGSGIGAGVDTVAGLVGYATPGSVAVGRTKPIFDLVLKMVPRFEGPQSDKDTQLYKDAAGDLANPNVPNSRKKAAGREILRLMRARKGQFIDKANTGTEIDAPTGQAKFLGFE